MESKAVIQGVTPCVGGAVLVLKVSNPDGIAELEGDLKMTLTRWREKRSLNANRYAWALINEIANVNRASKDEVYVEMLKHYGQSQMVSVLKSVDVSRYFKYYEPVATVTLQGKEFTHYRVYIGSSEYDTREMAVFIDGIVSEAKELGIDTMTPSEINELKERWGIEVG
jgi:hypothetical protein